MLFDLLRPAVAHHGKNRRDNLYAAGQRTDQQLHDPAHEGRAAGTVLTILRRLKAGESVSTNTLDALCKILQCDIRDIVEYLPDNN